MVRSAHLFLAAVLAAVIPSTALADGPTWPQIKATSSWEHLSDRDHDDAGTVKVAVAEIGGLKCLRGTATISGKAESFLGVATDIKGSIKWSKAGLSESAVLGGSGSVIDYYQYLDVPGWTGASDRFWFLRGTKEVSGSTHTFWWDRMGDNGGPYAERFTQVQTAHPKAVEPPMNVGGWMFTQRGGNVDVGYYVCSDTGGSLPRAIQYAAAKQTLPDTVGDLVREGKKRSQ
jgi:hypothetical protein